MKTTKIIHILLGKANPERQNGVNRVVFELAMSQHEEGHSTEVWGITHNPVVNFPERPFKTILFQDSRLKFKLSSKLIASISEAEKGTVFHLHGGFLPQIFSVAKHLVKHGHEYIYTPHGAFNTEALKRSQYKKQSYIRLFENRIVNNAKFVHVIGKSEIEGTRKVFGTDVKIELVPNGQRVPKESIHQKPVPRERSHFGFLGRLDIHTKGIDILLSGFERLVAKGSNAMLHIGGDGRDFQLIESEIEQRGLTNNVTLYGAVFGEEKNQFLAKLNYLCLTSRNEGLPGVVLESLAMNIPCIVSPETNMGDAIDEHDAGFVLKENSAEMLAGKLEQADKTIHSNEYIQRCYNAGRLIVDEFEWSKISQRLIQKFYEN